jgi:hypothetical protein
VRIPFGVDRLPREPGLRSVAVGCEVLRLNSEPVLSDAMPLATGDHAARVAAAMEWLGGQCGDYAPRRRQFIAAYFDCMAAQIAAHQDELAERLAQYDGLFAPEDALWSALRPLPRGWVPVADRYLPADVVFWDGTEAIAVELAARESERQSALVAAGVAVLAIDPAAFDRLHTLLPRSFLKFWDDDALPASPFRRTIPPSPA